VNGGPGRGNSAERGSATMFGVVFIGVLTTVAVLCVALGGLLVGHRGASSAADLAALAGAAAHQQGRVGCAAARSVAAENRSRLVSCELAGEVLTVVVAKDVRSAFGRTVTVTSQARAGPG